MPIISPHNEKLKEIRKLGQRRHRERASRFVAEGEDLLEAADRNGWQPVERFAATGSGLKGTQVEPELLAHASGLGSGTRTLAVYEERWAERPTGPLCVYLHGIHDPGNVGAILRSAEAFGASSVSIGPRTADPFGPKAVRASMGAIFTVPVSRGGELPGTTIALVAGKGEPLQTPQGEVTLMIGAERQGLPDEVIASADLLVHIAIKTHSLNAAMAATVALYETTRMARA